MMLTDTMQAGTPQQLAPITAGPESSRSWVQVNRLMVGYESLEFWCESAEFGYESFEFGWVRNDRGYESTGYRLDFSCSGLTQLLSQRH